MHLLDEPHHDGSPAYVDDEAPALGSTVTVRCRTATAAGIEEVWIRTTKDAEPTYHACRHQTGRARDLVEGRAPGAQPRTRTTGSCCAAATATTG